MVRSIACVVMAMSLLAQAPGLAMAASSTSKAKKKTAYGAIAWHADTSQFGYSYDFPTARAAKVAALQECAHERCEIMVSISNECGAIAKGAKGHAAKKGSTRAEAETHALNACGKDCRPVAWACTR